VLTCHLGSGVRARRLASIGRGKDKGDRTEALILLSPICLLRISDSTRMFADEVPWWGWCFGRHFWNATFGLRVHSLS
jgi:hypothetical protein